MNDLLSGATVALADRCDGAVQDDGIGYNGFDANIGHRLARKNPDQWTSGERRVMWKILRKYKKQLENYGINYSDIEEPKLEERKNGEHTPKIKKEILFDGKKFIVTFPYDKELIEAIKKIPTRRFNASNKYWEVGIALDAIQGLIKLTTDNDFEIVDEAMTEMEQRVTSYNENIGLSRKAELTENIDIKESRLKGTLRPFQKAGIAYAIKNKRCFIADDMGVGKTIQAIGAMNAPESYPAIIVCPASLKLNWQREINKWIPDKKVSILEGRGRVTLDASLVDIVIINYDILTYHVENLKTINPKMLVLDESHFAKSHKSKRSRACKELSKGIENILCLTGTPVLNRPKELISQLTILRRLEEFGGFWRFANRYCGAYKDRFGLQMGGATNLEELNERLRSICFIRRLKKDVLSELPPKQRSIIELEITNRKEYKQVEDDLVSYVRDRAISEEFMNEIASLSDEEQKQKINELKDAKEQATIRAETLVRIEKCKQVAAMGKLEGFYEWVDSFIETDEKLVIFADHIFLQKEIYERYKDISVHLFSEDKMEDRQASVDKFQTDENVKVFIASLKAGGVGITLTASSNVAFLELGFTPAIHDQAEDRCHRISQNDAVNIYYFIAKDTIDGEIYDLIEQKRIVVDGATDGDTSRPIEDLSVFNELIKKLRNH